MIVAVSLLSHHTGSSREDGDDSYDCWGYTVSERTCQQVRQHMLYPEPVSEWITHHEPVHFCRPKATGKSVKQRLAKWASAWWLAMLLASGVLAGYWLSIDHWPCIGCLLTVHSRLTVLSFYHRQVSAQFMSASSATTCLKWVIASLFRCPFPSVTSTSKVKLRSCRILTQFPVSLIRLDF